MIDEENVVRRMSKMEVWGRAADPVKLIQQYGGISLWTAVVGKTAIEEARRRRLGREVMERGKREAETQVALLEEKYAAESAELRDRAAALGRTVVSGVAVYPGTAVAATLAEREREAMSQEEGGRKWGSNLERFLAGQAQWSPRFIEGATRWDIGSVGSWRTLFEIVREAIRDLPTLQVVLDGGTETELAVVRDIFAAGLPSSGFTVTYRWVPPVRRILGGISLEGQNEWPLKREFQVVSSRQPAFHGFLNDIVVLLPPEDTAERKERWRDYLEGAWVSVVLEGRAGEQEGLVSALITAIEERLAAGKYAPWLFRANRSGGLEVVPCRPHGVIAIPKEVRQRLEST